MNKKLYVFLVVVVVFNTLRYGSYILEGAVNGYNLLLFTLNFLILLYGLFRAKEIIKTKENNV